MQASRASESKRPERDPPISAGSYTSRCRNGRAGTGDSLASYQDRGESGSLQRKFCRICGSSLASEAEAAPGAIVLNTGTLDDRSAVRPAAHTWTASAQPWVKIEEGVATFPKGRT